MESVSHNTNVQNDKYLMKLSNILNEEKNSMILYERWFFEHDEIIIENFNVATNFKMESVTHIPNVQNDKFLIKLSIFLKKEKYSKILDERLNF